MKKTNITLILLLLISTSAFAEIGNYSYEEIPFGTTYEEIKNLFKNEKVSIKESNRIELQFNKVFNLGILSEMCEPYQQWGTGGVAGKSYSYESQQIGSYKYKYVKILEVYSEKYWKNLSMVVFYFIDVGNQQYKLFLYEKSFKSDDEFTNEEFYKVIDKQSEQISSSLNIQPINKQKKYFQYNSRTDDIAYCYSWLDKQIKIYFIGSTFTSNRPTWIFRHIYYYDSSYEEISKKQKQKYMEEAELEEKRKSQEKMNNLELDF